MNIAIINLPYLNRIVRRYKCTYNSSTFLLPPLELLYIASAVRMGNRLFFLDCIAENINQYLLFEKLRNKKIDIIITMVGIESLDFDLETLYFLKKKFSTTKILITGYLPTLFPEEFLHNNYIDFIISGESEWSIKKLIDSIKSGKSYSNLENLSYREKGKIILNKRVMRLKNLDELDFPSRDLINNNLYNEPMVSKPFTTILTSRGCTYGCPYCIPTYGKNIYFRSIKNVIDELKEIVLEFDIKNIRFMDDTLTISKERIISLCKNIINEKLIFNWSCLSRIDLIDEEIISIMKKSGCKRIYVGIESGSERVLRFFKRKYSIEDIKVGINLIKKYNIEISAFFISGGPFESEEDFQKTLDLIDKLNCDYYILDHLTPYPGTELFNLLRDKIHFSLFPYKNYYKDDFIEKIYHKREKEFYKKGYFNFKYMKKSFNNIIKHPDEAFLNFKSLLNYIQDNKKRKKYI